MTSDRHFGEWGKDEITKLIDTIGFYGLVAITRSIIAQHSPADIFTGNLDKGPRFIDKLSEALAILDD